MNRFFLALLLLSACRAAEINYYATHPYCTQETLRYPPRVTLRVDSLQLLDLVRRASAQTPPSGALPGPRPTPRRPLGRPAGLPSTATR